MDKSRLMMFVIIALLVILIGTVVGGIVILMRPAPDPEIWADPPEQLPLPVQRRSFMDLIEVSLGERINTNLATGLDGRPAIVLTEVAVGVDGLADQAEIDAFMASFEARIAFARAVILDEFGKALYDDVNSVEGRAALAEVMTQALQEQFETNLIIRVFFSEWNLQRR